MCTGMTESDRHACPYFKAAHRLSFKTERNNDRVHVQIGKLCCIIRHTQLHVDTLQYTYMESEDSYTFKRQRTGNRAAQCSAQSHTVLRYMCMLSDACDFSGQTCFSMHTH